MISQPLAPILLSDLSLPFITALIMELAANLTGILFKSLNLRDSAKVLAQIPLALTFYTYNTNCSGSYPNLFYIKNYNSLIFLPSTPYMSSGLVVISILMGVFLISFLHNRLWSRILRGNSVTPHEKHNQLRKSFFFHSF